MRDGSRTVHRETKPPM